MVKTNGAFPLPPYDPRFMPGCPKRDDKGMNYIGKRSNEWLENKVDAKAQEVYYNEDTNEYWMSIGYNRWEKWQGIASGPKPTPTKDVEIYSGSLIELPEDLDALEDLKKITVTTEDLKNGLKLTIEADDDYVTIAFKSNIGPISSILEDGFEAVSDFEKYDIDDYVFYCTSDTVYDPDGEIQYTITWGIN